MERGGGGIGFGMFGREVIFFVYGGGGVFLRRNCF